jgi:hypothetical protein
MNWLHRLPRYCFGMVLFFFMVPFLLSATLPKILSIDAKGRVEVMVDGQSQKISMGQQTGTWTLMAVLPGENEAPRAIFEELRSDAGEIVFANAKGILLRLGKSAEPTFSSNSNVLYHGHSLQEVLDSPTDLLGQEILNKPGDPTYAEIAACFPPITKTVMAYTFAGTRQNMDKVGFYYGGETAHFDPAVYLPQIREIRKQQKVWDGLVGGWRPILRFVYPENEGTWSEMVAFAPPRMENGNPFIQPVWYRVSHIENNGLKWVRYFDSYHPFPPRMESPAGNFYRDMEFTVAHWDKELQPAMQIEVPDERLSNMARHSLVRDMITRAGIRPKYGVFDKNYGGSEHEGFPDIFTADTSAMLAWGLLDLSRQYIDNYFGQYVRDDGSILYRGPETGQYGRMLTVLASYVRYSGDINTLLKNRTRIDAVARLLLEMRRTALELPKDSPAYGLISGWSEADACLDPEPQRYMQPYFSNSTEAVRGFRELGEVWREAGKKRNDASLVDWGKQLVEESEALDKDVQQGISRSVLRDENPPYLPAIAGVKIPFHIAVARDRLDPLHRSYRAYMEMLHSGTLTRDQVDMIVNYRAAHHDIILGIPTAYSYNSHELVGFLSYGHGFGLLQHDFTREFLLSLYSLMAHQYTRGSWTAPETRNIEAGRPSTPYCTPAQLTVPMMVRWMLLLEDPASGVLWLAKGTPREWLEDGQQIVVRRAPIRRGLLDFRIQSRIRQGFVEAEIHLPATGIGDPLILRLRAPEGSHLKGVEVNGKPWANFDPKQETIQLPPALRGIVEVKAFYR